MIHSGELILEQMPYAAVIYEQEQASFCDDAFQHDSSAKRCSACKYTRYSSRGAQQHAWANGHDKECRALVTASPRVPPASVRLAARVLWRAASEKALDGRAAESATSPQQSTFAELKNLEDHWTKLDDDRRTQLAQMAMLTRNYMYGAEAVNVEVGVPVREIALILARFACNNHTICDDELRAIGVGLYPTGALINHSRGFNAVQSFQGPKVRFVAVRDVLPGEEITISYMDLKCTRPDRRLFLQRHYHFDIDDGSMPLPLPIWSGSSVGGARASYTATAPAMLDAPDGQLTQLLTAGAHMLPMVTESLKAPTNSCGNSDHAGDLAGRNTCAHKVLLYFWGHGLCTPGENILPSTVASAAAAVAVKIFDALKSADAALEVGLAATAADALHVALCEGRKVLGKRNVLLLKLLEAHLRSSIAAGDRWSSALASARQLMPFYELVYPTGISPEFGLLMASTAKIAAVVEDDVLAASAAEHAVRILQTCSGGSSAVVREMVQLRHDIGAQIGVHNDL